jgi:VanZ family protein
LTALARLFAWPRAAVLGYQRAPLLVRALLVLGWMGVLWWLSDQSQLPEIGGRFSGLVHNAGHLPAYAILGALWYLLLPVATRHRVLLAIVASGLYGVVDEIHQSFVPHRCCDPYDVVSDTMGAAVACSWCAWLVTGDPRCWRALPWLVLGAAAAAVASTWHPI